jgi:hypothetical protein
LGYHESFLETESLQVSFLPQTFVFPGFVLPLFVIAALLMAVLVRLEGRARLALLALTAVAGVGFAGSRIAAMRPAETPSVPPAIEVDMRVSRGTIVDLFVNDWQHPPERLPVAPGVRQVYRFSNVPRDIRLVRLDPTDLPDARIEIYSLKVKAGTLTVREVRPEELKNWTLVNVSPPAAENDALVLQARNDDPILWTSGLAIHIPGETVKPSVVWKLAWPIAFLLGVIPALALFFFLTPPAFAVKPWFALLIAILAAVATLGILRLQVGSGVVLEVDMSVSRGRAVELYLNDWQHPPERVPIVAGERHVYQFRDVPSHITLLRLDPTDQPEARIVLYSVTIRNSTHVFHQFGPADLRNWKRTNLAAAPEENDGLAFTGQNDDPILVTPIDLRLPLRWVPFLDTNDAVFLLAIMTFLVLLLARMPGASGWREGLLVAAATCAAYPIVRLVLGLSLLPPPGVHSTVGYASYAGYRKANEYLASTFVLLVCIALGWLFARFRHEFRREAPGPVEETSAPSRPLHACLAAAAVFALLGMYFLPDLRAALASMPEAAFDRSGWDDMNWLYWDYLITRGLRPFRDFWFPYSGAYVQDLRAPVGLLMWTFQKTIALGGLYLGLFKATGRRLTQAIVIFGLVLAPVLLNMLASWHRYLLAADVALLYVAARYAQRWEWSTHLPLALWTGYVFFYEPTLIVYVGAGIAVDTLLTLVSQRHQLVPLLRRRLILVAAPMLAGIAVAVLAFASNGMLAGFWDFERSLGDQGDYSALPAEVARWVRLELQPDSIFLLMFLLSAYAVYRCVRVPDRDKDLLGTALLIVCCTSFMAMQKQILRPHAMLQVRVFPYLAVLLFGLIAWRERKPAARAVIAAFLGCVVAVFIQRHLPEQLWTNEVEQAPQRIAGAADALLHKRTEFAKASAALYSRPHFARFEVENAVVDELTRSGLAPGDSVYVLGDASIFYILLDQPGPYVTNSYNESPLSEQRKVLEWLREKRPKFVIWQAGVLSFDEVPHVVRLPLIYRYVVDHYRFVKAIGPYHVLAGRPAGQAIDLESWRAVLGERLDLGHVPGLSQMSDYEGCAGDRVRCDPVLVIRYAAAPDCRKLTIHINTFRVELDVDPADRDYVVNLDRLWFWSAVANPLPQITVDDKAAQLSILHRQQRGPVLY